MDVRSGATILSRQKAETSKMMGAGKEMGEMPFQLDPQANNEEIRLLRLAGTMLERSRDLESRIAAIETASQTCKCAKILSESVVDILGKAKELLLKIREVADPSGRLILVGSFNNILKQIDTIVTDGYYDGKNLAQNDKIVITTDQSQRQMFSIAGIDMSCRGLDLEPLTGDAITNADIVDRLGKIETAMNDLVAHSFSYDAITFLLQSRTKFARGMIDILEDGNSQINNSLTGNDAISRVVSRVCKTITHDPSADTTVARSA